MAALQMAKAGEISDTLENSLAVLREYQDAEETRQQMQLEGFSQENKWEGIDKVNAAMTQVITACLHSSRRGGGTHFASLLILVQMNSLSAVGRVGGPSTLRLPMKIKPGITNGCWYSSMSASNASCYSCT